jgi:hypothetical protein
MFSYGYRPCVVTYSWGAITPTTGASPGSSRVTYLQSARTRCPASSLPKVRTRVREVSRTARLNISACSFDARENRNLSHGRSSHDGDFCLWKTSTPDFEPQTADLRPQTSDIGVITALRTRRVLRAEVQGPKSGVGRRARAIAIIDQVVGIAQLVEHRTVAPTVAGSIPVSHPRFSYPARRPCSSIG